MTTVEKANEIKTRIMSVAKELKSIHVDYEKYLGVIVSESISEVLYFLDSFTVEEDLNWKALAEDFEVDSSASSAKDEFDKNMKALIENIKKVVKSC